MINYWQNNVIQNFLPPIDPNLRNQVTQRIQRDKTFDKSTEGKNIQQFAIKNTSSQRMPANEEDYAEASRLLNLEIQQLRMQ